MRTTERKGTDNVADGFILKCPLHYPDGTEAKELPLYPDIEKIFVEFLRQKIDEQHQKGARNQNETV